MRVSDPKICSDEAKIILSRFRRYETATLVFNWRVPTAISVFAFVDGISSNIRLLPMISRYGAIFWNSVQAKQRLTIFLILYYILGVIISFQILVVSSR